MGAPVYLTKGELRSKLLIRLGYGGLGAAAGAFVPTADDFLEEGQELIFELLPDAARVRVWDMTTSINQRWYDIPTDCDHDEIQCVSRSENGTWIPMTKGIGLSEDSSFSDVPGEPEKYDIKYNATTGRAQIEIWPNPDAAYAWRIEGGMTPNNFVADGDRAVVDSRLILLYAIAYGKAHLGKRDAEAAMNAWTTRFRAMKAKQHRGQVYVRRNPGHPQVEVRRKPQVI